MLRKNKKVRELRGKFIYDRRMSMKKLLALCFLLLLVQGVYASGHIQLTQENVEDIVNKCVSLLGKPVPEGAIRYDRIIFKVPYKDWEIAVIVEDGLILCSAYVGAYYTTGDASAFLGQFYTFFEDSNRWKYVGRITGDAYYNNDAYASLTTGKRDDGLISALISFARDIETFHRRW
jgi:hypothetical protein